jgi:hypothetical protein
MDKEPNRDKFIYLASVFRDAAYGAQRLAHALMSVATSVRDAKELPEPWQDNDPLRDREENAPEPIEDPWDRTRPSNPPPFNPFQPLRSEEPSDYAGQRQMNHELDAYDNLMGNFSFTIDQAMRKLWTSDNRGWRLIRR